MVDRDIYHWWRKQSNFMCWGGKNRGLEHKSRNWERLFARLDFRQKAASKNGRKLEIKSSWISSFLIVYPYFYIWRIRNNIIGWLKSREKAGHEKVFERKQYTVLGFCSVESVDSPIFEFAFCWLENSTNGSLNIYWIFDPCLWDNASHFMKRIQLIEIYSKWLEAFNAINGPPAH